MRAVMTITLVCVFLAGCNSIAGVGEDITGVARWGQSMIGGGY